MTIEPETSTAAAGGDKSLPPRREYTLEMKRRIVEETFAPESSVSIVSRRHNVNTNLLFNWRQRYRDGTLGPSKPASKAKASVGQDLIRVGVIDHAGSLHLAGPPASPSPPPSPPTEVPAMQLGRTPDSSRIEIELPNGFKVRVEGEVDDRALTRVLMTIRELA